MGGVPGEDPESHADGDHPSDPKTSKGPFDLTKQPERFQPDSIRVELKETYRDELTILERKALGLPEAMGATEGVVANVRIHLRGNHLTLGPEVPRRFPSILRPARSKLRSARRK